MSAAVPMEQGCPAKVPEWRNVDLRTLREEIIPRDEPGVLKGFVAEWPIARIAAQSPEALLEYVRARDPGHPIKIMVGRPGIRGLYFYRDDMMGLSFEYQDQPLHAALANILASRTLARQHQGRGTRSFRNAAVTLCGHRGFLSPRRT